MKSGLSIKTRLFLIILATLACFSTLLYITSILTIQRFTSEQTVKDLENSLRYAKNQFNARPELAQEILRLQSSSPELIQHFETRNKAALNKSISQWRKSMDFLEIVVLFDSSGNVITRINNNTETKSFLSSELLNKALQAKQPFTVTELVSEADYEKETVNKHLQLYNDNRDIMVQLIIVPVISPSGATIGFIVAGDEVNKDPHLPYAQQLVFGKTVDMFITQRGEVVASTFTEPGWQNVPIEPRMLQSLKGGFTFNDTTLLNGKNYEVIAEPLHNLRGEFIGSLTVALEAGKFSSFYRDYNITLFFFGLVSLLVIIPIAYYAAASIVSPLGKFSTALQNIETGNFSSELDESGLSEFAELAKKSNKLARLLSERNQQCTMERQELVQNNAALMDEISKIKKELAAEKQLRKVLLHSLDDGVIITDSDLRVIEASDAIAELFGYPNIPKKGESIRDLFKKVSLSAAIPLLEKQSDQTEEQIIVNRRGRTLRISRTGIFRHEGLMAATLIGVHDITTEGELERLKSGFMAKISHELKTPLTSMTGSLQFILKKGKWLTSTEREMLEVCLRNTGRLITQISSILELSRIEAGQVKFNFKPLQIIEPALQAAEDCKMEALRKNIAIVNDIQFDAPRVYGDQDRLAQVIYNLLSNAVKFSPVYSVITMSTRCENGFLAFFITDAAPLIPAEQVSSLFKKFQQTGNPDDGESTGGGLGLAICREIIIRHKGEIFHSVGAAGGNVFTFKIPLDGVDNA